MGKTSDSISPELRTWLGSQWIFFVSTAPSAADGHINCSPKGGDTFRVLSERVVAYLDLTGSGIETIAHFQENGRVVIMFCAFAGAPRIVRLHGKGEVVYPGDPGFNDLLPQFPKRKLNFCTTRLKKFIKFLTAKALCGLILYGMRRIISRIC